MRTQTVLGARLLSLLASSARAQDNSKGWLDVNLGAATAAEDSFTSTKVLTISQEAGGGSVAYGVPRGGAFDVGGGYMFTPRLGFGVSLAATAHEDAAGLAISVPHPLYFNASARDADVTDSSLTRTEGAWHIQAMLVAASTPRVRLRLFAGPTYFRAEQEVVTNIRYDQVYQLLGRGNVVDITTYSSAKEVGTGWGFHGGGDLSVFFTRVFGLGGSVRLSRGTVSIQDYGGTHDISTGGVQINAGVRFRF